MKGIPNRLRVVRAEKRVTQLDTALAVGISQTQLSLIENRYANPSPDERARLARVLGVSEADLFPTTEAESSTETA